MDLQRIRDRKLVQWGLAYLSACWLLLQLADVLESALGLSPAHLRILVVLLVLGLPLVLVIAWYHGEKGRQSVSGPELLILGALLVLVGAVVSVFVPPLEEGSTTTLAASEGESVGEALLDRRSVAVLPFTNLSADPEDAYFADGIHEELIGRLSKISALRVISRTSVMRYRDARQDMRQIAEALGVGTVLEGSVRRSAERLRISAQLIDARTDDNLWTETYDRTLSAENVFRVQSEIADRVANSLEASLTAEERSRIYKSPTGDDAAYVHYLKGRHIWNERRPERYPEALDHFNQALAIDPDFAPAFSGLADVYVHLDDSGGHPEGARARAFEAARNALALDEGLAEAHSSLAHLLMHAEEWDESEREYQRAIELDPSNPQALRLYAFHLSAWGRYDEAIRHAERAVATAPIDVDTNNFLAYTYYFARRYEQAIAAWERFLDLHPDQVGAHFLIAGAHVLSGRNQEGLQRGGKAMALADGAPWGRVAWARVLALAGKHAEAQQILSDVVSAARERLDPLTTAQAYATLGDLDEAFHWLGIAGNRDHGWLMFLRVEPSYDALRADPRFAAWLRRMRFVE